MGPGRLAALPAWIGSMPSGFHSAENGQDTGREGIGGQGVNPWIRQGGRCPLAPLNGFGPSSWQEGLTKASLQVW